MSLLRELIDKYVLQLEDPDLEEAAEQILRELLKHPDDLIIALTHPLRSYLIAVIRQQSLRAERHGPLEHNTPVDPIADRMEWLQHRVMVPGVGFVAWGEMTVKHHELRIEYLQKKMTGIEEAMMRHSEAITLIEQAKAKNLNEVYRPKRKHAS